MPYGLRNNATSKLTAGIGTTSTSVSITVGEGQLFINNSVATLESRNSDGNVVKREVVLISNVSGDTLTIERAYGPCVVDDTAEDKEMQATAQSFSVGDSISIYLASEMIQDLYTPATEVDDLATCICCCHDTRLAQVMNKICSCYGDFSRGNGSDGNRTISGCDYLCANREYFFDNLTIQSGACLRFRGQGVPRIHVKGKFCNMGTIDLRGGDYVGACSFTNCLGTITNRYCSSDYNAMCYGCGGKGGTTSYTYNSESDGPHGGNGGNANVSGGTGKGGCAGLTSNNSSCVNGCNGCNGGNATGGGGGGASGACNLCVQWNTKYGHGSNNSGYNGGSGGSARYLQNSISSSCCCCCVWTGAGGGGGGGGYLTGNGGNGGDGCTMTSCSRPGGMKGGDGGNGGIFGTGGNGGKGRKMYCTYGSSPNSKCRLGIGGKGGNGYCGGNGGNSELNYEACNNPYMICGCGGNGGMGVVKGGNGGCVVLKNCCSYSGTLDASVVAGNGGKAINNMYALGLWAKCFYNSGTICGSGGNGGNGGNISVDKMANGGYNHILGSGGNGGSGACIMIVYNCNLQKGTITCNGGTGGSAGTISGFQSCTPGTAGTNGSAGTLKFCCREATPA